LHVGELVRLEVSDGVGTIRLDRPKMNALNAQMQQEMVEVWPAYADYQRKTAREIPVVVLERA